MDIKGIDYNTQREKLVMPEYGREIQKMVDHAVALPDRKERLRCAKTIVKLMATMAPQLRENAGYQQTLWDHLYLMSNRQLDIDWPYDVNRAEHMLAKPAPMPRPATRFTLRHYGHLVEELWERLKTMPPGKERDELTRHTANQMKRDLVLWGHGSIDDEKVASDLAHFTGGVIQLDLRHFTFEHFVPANEMPPTGKKGRKRK